MAEDYALAPAAEALAVFNFSIAAWSSVKRVASSRSVSCSWLVALAMGAVTPGCTINHANATLPGVE